MACAQCASMPLIRLLMLMDMLVCESRMVVHVTVCAIQSRILGSPSIKTKSLLDPLHVRLLVLPLEVVILWGGVVRFEGWWPLRFFPPALFLYRNVREMPAEGCSLKGGS